MASIIQTVDALRASGFSLPLSPEVEECIRSVVAYTGIRSTFAHIAAVGDVIRSPMVNDAVALAELDELLTALRCTAKIEALKTPETQPPARLQDIVPRRVSVRQAKVSPKDALTQTPAGTSASVEGCRLYFIPQVAAKVPAGRHATHWLLKAIRQVASASIGSVAPLTADTSCAVALDRDRRLVGFCAVVQLDEAQRLVPPEGQATQLSVEQGWASLQHSLGDSEPGTFCGVQLVWVSDDFRRKGLAAEMVDVARCNLVYRMEIERAACAFSQPTPDGKLFARGYTGRPDFWSFH
jgi:hypothetical protein